ncbi:MAG: hypothetical protein HKN92_06075 [Chitinophagales bacterium]|nr:hypothetical protein [Chitinophagales bacterium]
MERNAHKVKELDEYLKTSPFSFVTEQVKSISKCISRIKKSEISAVVLNYEMSVNLLDEILRELLKERNIPLIVISKRKKAQKQKILKSLDPVKIISTKKSKSPSLASLIIASIRTEADQENDTVVKEDHVSHSIASNSYFIFSPPSDIVYYTAEVFPLIQSIGKSKFMDLLDSLYGNYNAGIRKLELSRDKAIFTLEMHKTSWKNEFAIAVEISKSKTEVDDLQFHESFNDLFESDITAMIIHDGEHIIEANQLALDFFNIDRHVITGIELRKVIKSDLNFSSILFAKKEDIHLRSADGSEMIKTVTTRPIRYSGKRCWISVFTPAGILTANIEDSHLDEIINPLEEISELISNDFTGEKEFLSEILERLCTELDLEFGFIAEQSNGSLKLAYRYGDDPNLSSKNSFPLFGTIESDIVKFNELYHYDDSKPIGLEGKNYRFPAHKASVYIGLPIDLKEDKSAVLAVYSNQKKSYDFNTAERITVFKYSSLIASYFSIKHKLIENSVDSILNEVASESADKKEVEYLMKMASHDLQEPLRIIYNYSEILKRKLKGFPDKGKSEEFLSYLTFIKESADKIDQLIKGFKSYVAIQDNSDDSSSHSVFKLTDLFEEVILDMSEKIDSTNTSISIGEMPTISANRDSLRILLFQLIDNAVTYKAKDKNPVIQIESRDEEDYWILSFKDNGVGIEKKYLEKIFHVLEKVDNSSPTSSGLGLSMCKSIVEQHGGKIWADSMPGYGSTFYFSIPKN